MPVQQAAPAHSRTRSPFSEEATDVARRVEELSRNEWGPLRGVEIVGTHPLVKQVHDKVAKVAAFEEPVLITGESGVGKELLAQAIYLLGPRRGAPLITVNCPQYHDGNLTVSELFGHKRGSFTGATEERRGCFETADRGVIFLDEIGDLHLQAQVMLMRALATGEFQPLGEEHPRRVNVRVIAATNRPLGDLMVGNEFRQDLFFRLRYFHLDVPPLRARGDDWIALLQHALEKLRRKYGVRKRFSAASMTLLSTHTWPGNIRELITIATTGYAMSESDLIEPDDFVSSLSAKTTAAPVETAQTLYRRLSDGGSFWDSVHAPFLRRDISRGDVRSVIRLGLAEAGGSYRQLLSVLRLPSSDYQRFMDFLRHHDLKPQ